MPLAFRYSKTYLRSKDQTMFVIVGVVVIIIIKSSGSNLWCRHHRHRRRHEYQEQQQQSLSPPKPKVYWSHKSSPHLLPERTRQASELLLVSQKRTLALESSWLTLSIQKEDITRETNLTHNYCRRTSTALTHTCIKESTFVSVCLGSTDVSDRIPMKCTWHCPSKRIEYAERRPFTCVRWSVHVHLNCSGSMYEYISKSSLSWIRISERGPDQCERSCQGMLSAFD